MIVVSPSVVKQEDRLRASHAFRVARVSQMTDRRRYIRDPSTNERSFPHPPGVTPTKSW